MKARVIIWTSHIFQSQQEEDEEELLARAATGLHFSEESSEAEDDEEEDEEEEEEVVPEKPPLPVKTGPTAERHAALKRKFETNCIKFKKILVWNSNMFNQIRFVKSSNPYD